MTFTPPLVDTSENPAFPDQKTPRLTLITGAGSGMGQHAAQAFAAAGYRVAAADISRPAAEKTVSALAGSGHRAFVVDISDEVQVARLFDEVERELGAVDVLQTFAGVMIYPSDGKRPSIADSSLSDWERTFAVNSRGTFLCVREFLRRRRGRGVDAGRVITISSSNAQLGGYNGSAAYIASKGAVLSLTKIAAREAAPMGITVNCIAPGAVDSPMLRAVMPRDLDAAHSEKVPMGRIGLPEDVSAAALYLASPAAGYVTGCCIDVNGGLRMQ